MDRRRRFGVLKSGCAAFIAPNRLSDCGWHRRVRVEGSGRMMARVLTCTSALQAPRRSFGLRPAARHVMVRASAEPSDEPHQGPEPSPHRGRRKRVSKEQLLASMERVIAAMDAVRTNELWDRVATKTEDLSARLTAYRLAEAANAESLTRMSFAPGMQGARLSALVLTGEELVDLVSCAGWPASLDPVLGKVLEGHCGYLAVRQLLLAELARLAPAVEALLPLFEPVPPATDATWWEAEGDQIGQVMVAVEQHRQAGGRTVPQRLMPHLAMLFEYCFAAAEAAADPEGGMRSLHEFLLAVQVNACAPVVTLVAALAAGKLRTEIAVCGGPRLFVQGCFTIAEMMEFNRPGRKGLLKARRRLQEDGRVVNWLVHVANPALAAAFPLKLRGVLTTQRMDEEERNKWFSSRHHVDVGCPSLGSAAGSVTMPLQLRWF
ncbi:hypothetical protein ABPG77_000413 [Micractinium sp. CCAP 211/92]